LVRYGEFPYQIPKHDGECFEEMKMIDLLEKPSEDENVSSASISLNDEEHCFHGNYDDII
jgi:hypothetical protein